MSRPGSGPAALLAALLALAAALDEPDDAALRCPAPAPGRQSAPEPLCNYTGGTQDDYQYWLEGKTILIRMKSEDVSVYCNGFDVLESPGLPRAVSETTLTQVTLSGCPLPAAGSLADTLAALNVTLLRHGTLILTKLPHSPQLTEQHFLGLENLLILHVSALKNEKVNPDQHFLKPLKNLEVLKMEQVMLPPSALNKPPPLKMLTLEYTGVKRLPEALLSSIHLQTLTVTSNSTFDAVRVPPGLLELTLSAEGSLDSSAVTLQLNATPALRVLRLSNWVEDEPAPLRQCDHLTIMQLTSPSVRVLPGGWLANCSRLEKLELQYAKNLTSLPENLLKNANALTLLSFKQCALETLPVGLLKDAPKLRKLYLFGNYLRILPSDLFEVARNVELVDLSFNELGRDALAALAPLKHLGQLDLQNNKLIRNLCDRGGKSPFNQSTKLTKLNLSHTNINHICSDWREDMDLLETLDLNYTNVTELTFEELQFKRVKNSVVFLGAALTAVTLTHLQYNSENTNGKTIVYIDKNSTLKCDCNMYWTRRALDSPHKPLIYIMNMQCTEKIPLKYMSPEDMVCTDAEAVRECEAAGLPHECACSRRPDDEPAAAPGGLRLRVNCSDLNLTQVPLPSVARKHRYDLLLSHNLITELPADALRFDIKKLDLSNNHLKELKADALTRLGTFDGILHLANNKLDCSCSVAPLLLALKYRLPNLTDLANAKCEDGSALNNTPIENCLPLLPLGTWLTWAAAAVLALVIAVVALLASRERRFFIKAVLHRWGCSCCGSETDNEDDRRFDAFVTFSHKDELVVRELVARLEPTYRLCVHHRDWIPGRYIVDQIEESVRDSRRTIALVSRHFLTSRWALAEFRQAHEAAMLEAKPRLVVVLLEDPSTLELDQQLRRYLATKTYVRWRDPWFWDKLALALPRPRPPAAASGRAAPSARPSTSDPLLPKREVTIPKKEVKMTMRMATFSTKGVTQTNQYNMSQSLQTANTAV